MSKLVKDWKTRLSVIFLAWGFWWLLAAFKTFLETRDGDGESLGHTLIDYAYVGIIWIAVTPIIILVSERINRISRLELILTLHLISAILVLFIRTLPYSLLTLTHNDPRISFTENWADIMRIQFLGNFIIYGLIATSYLALVWYEEYKDSELKSLKLNLKSSQLEQQLLAANLMTLRMQLNPHFLFNTLHSVASLIRVKRSNDAIDTIAKLSDMLRSTVYSGDIHEVAISEEVRFIEKYLEIEKLRFDDRLDVVWQIDNEVLDYNIPKLLLQPIVENSLKHGLRDATKGKISIEIRKHLDHKVLIIVDDNGAGVPDAFDIHADAGVGLQITKGRLEGTYGADFELSIGNNPSGEGVSVRLILPLKEANS